MAFYLGIYGKNKLINGNEVLSAVTDFSCNGTRNVKSILLAGFHFYYVSQFENGLLFDRNKISMLSGWINEESNSKPTLAELLPEVHQRLEEKGTSALCDFEGAFTLVHYNVKDHRLILANDKFGMVPMFIFENSNHIVFCNEYEPLTWLPNGRALNAQAIAEYFTLGTTLGYKTFLKTIQNLPPASFVKADVEGVVRRNYWRPEVSVDLRSKEILAKETWDLFSQINQETFGSGLTEVTLLSAGADSRLIVSTLTEAQRASAVFYTSNLSFLSEDEDKDAVGAKLLVQKFKLQHRLEKISHYENEFGKDYFANWRILRQAQVYGGWLGGEFLGGYCFSAAPLNLKVDQRKVENLVKAIFTKQFRKDMDQQPFEAYKSFIEPGLLHYIRQFTQSFFSSIYGGTRGHWLQPFQLANHGYSPFWDSRLIKKLLSIPLDLLRDYQFYNLVFSNAKKEFLEIPSNSPLTNRADSVIPKLVIGKEPKHHLPDMHHAIYLQRLEDKRIWERGIYRRRKMKHFLKDENDVISRRWLDFEVWYSNYMGL